MFLMLRHSARLEHNILKITRDNSAKINIIYLKKKKNTSRTI